LIQCKAKIVAEGKITTMSAVAHDCERSALADPDWGLAAPRQAS
jgi:hypothetical protein